MADLRGLRGRPVVLSLGLGLAALGAGGGVRAFAQAKAAAPAAGAPVPVAAKAAPAALDPAREKATQLREAASLLDKAADALARGNRSFAEQLFSSAEILVGVEAVADVASRFRAGAPPRVNSPTVMVPDAGALPKTAGRSEEDEPDDKPAKGSLSGTLTLDSKGGAVGVVTLEPVGRKASKRRAKQRVMQQRNRQFAPQVLAVPLGSTVSFPNYDPTYHNVFSISESKPFDLGLYKSGQSREVTFDKEGIVRVGCNLHASMAGWVVVVAAPHYAVTDEDGRFKFGSLAPGKYKLKAWSERSREAIEREVVIKAGANSLDVTVLGDAPTGPSPDKFGVPRGGKK